MYLSNIFLSLVARRFSVIYPLTSRKWSRLGIGLLLLKSLINQGNFNNKPVFTSKLFLAV